MQQSTYRRGFIGSMLMLPMQVFLFSILLPMNIFFRVVNRIPGMRKMREVIPIIYKSSDWLRGKEELRTEPTIGRTQKKETNKSGWISSAFHLVPGSNLATSAYHFAADSAWRSIEPPSFIHEQKEEKDKEEGLRLRKRERDVQSKTTEVSQEKRMEWEGGPAQVKTQEKTVEEPFHRVREEERRPKIVSVDFSKAQAKPKRIEISGEEEKQVEVPIRTGRALKHIRKSDEEKSAKDTSKADETSLREKEKLGKDVSGKEEIKGKEEVSGLERKSLAGKGTELKKGGEEKRKPLEEKKEKPLEEKKEQTLKKKEKPLEEKKEQTLEKKEKTIEKPQKREEKVSKGKRLEEQRTESHGKSFQVPIKKPKVEESKQETLPAWYNIKESQETELKRKEKPQQQKQELPQWLQEKSEGKPEEQFKARSLENVESNIAPKQQGTERKEKHKKRELQIPTPPAPPSMDYLLSPRSPPVVWPEEKQSEQKSLGVSSDKGQKKVSYPQPAVVEQIKLGYAHPLAQEQIQSYIPEVKETRGISEAQQTKTTGISERQQRKDEVQSSGFVNKGADLGRTETNIDESLSKDEKATLRRKKKQARKREKYLDRKTQRAKDFVEASQDTVEGQRLGESVPVEESHQVESQESHQEGTHPEETHQGVQEESHQEIQQEEKTVPQQQEQTQVPLQAVDSRRTEQHLETEEEEWIPVKAKKSKLPKHLKDRLRETLIRERLASESNVDEIVLRILKVTENSTLLDKLLTFYPFFLGQHLDNPEEAFVRVNQWELGLFERLNAGEASAIRGQYRQLIEKTPTLEIQGTIQKIQTEVKNREKPTEEQRKRTQETIDNLFDGNISEEISTIIRTGKASREDINKLEETTRALGGYVPTSSSSL